HVDFEPRFGIAVAPMTASCAVVTLPLALLQRPPGEPGAVRFVPDVPEIRAACGGSKMGNVVKVLLRFREPFWREARAAGVGFLRLPGEMIPTWWTQEPMSSGVLTGWTGGPAATRLSHPTTQAIVRESLRPFARAFGWEASSRAGLLKAFQAVDWSRDRFAGGAYSHGVVGGATLATKLAEPVANTLFFAGEHTHDELRGTVSGALASGHRAAEQVLAA